MRNPANGTSINRSSFLYFVGLTQIYFLLNLLCLVLISTANLLTSKYEKHTIPKILKNYLKTRCKCIKTDYFQTQIP